MEYYSFALGVLAIAKGRYAEWLTPDGLTMIFGWARDGLTDAQIAHNMGVSMSTLQDWKAKYPPIMETLKKGKAPVDIEVENALLKRALGYDYEERTTEEYANGKKHTRTVTKHVPGDVTAQIFWLKNRKPVQWREKQQIALGADVEDLTPLVEMLKDG